MAIKRKIKSQFHGIPVFTWIRFAFWALMLLMFLILTIVLLVQKNSLPDQLGAIRWDDDKNSAQVSAFFTSEAMINGEMIPEWRYNIENKLQEKSVINENENARLYIDAYAAKGNLYMENDYGDYSVDVMGVGGDFFLIHPLKMIYGGYFSESDLMHDAIILDEESAWNLYGSSDIVGKTVLIGNVEHRIVGVYEREDSKLFKKAGGGKNLCYVSYDTLNNSGTAEPISTYEVIMPNVVKGFALQILKDSCNIDENSVSYIDNSARFSYESLYTVLQTKQERIMKTNTIVYPPYENVARAVEGKVAYVALWQVICLIVFVIGLSLEGIVYYRKHRITKEKIVRLWDKTVEFTRKKKTEMKERREKKKSMEQKGDGNEEI